MCRYGVDWRLMLVIFLGIAMWQRPFVHKKGIHAFEGPEMSETAEYWAGGLSRGTYRILQETLNFFSFLSSQSSACLQPGQWGSEVWWELRAEAGRWMCQETNAVCSPGMTWCGLVLGEIERLGQISVPHRGTFWVGFFWEEGRGGCQAALVLQAVKSPGFTKIRNAKREPNLRKWVALSWFWILRAFWNT